MDPISSFSKNQYPKDHTSPVNETYIDLFHRITSHCGEIQKSSKKLSIFLSTAIIEKIQQLPISKLIEMAFSFGSLMVYEKKLFDTLSDKVITETQNLEPSQIIKIAEAFAELNIHDVVLFFTLSQQARATKANFKQGEKETLIRSFRKIGIYNYDLENEFKLS